MPVLQSEIVLARVPGIWVFFKALFHLHVGTAYGKAFGFRVQGSRSSV